MKTSEHRATERVAIEKVALPAGSLIATLGGSSFTDHTDAFRARVDATQFHDVDAFARAFLG